MTTTTLTGTYTGGYFVQYPVTLLSITTTGYVSGGGVGAGPNAYTIVNDGRVTGTSNGIYLQGGGVVTNGAPSDSRALISGLYEGVKMGAVGAVTNFATITTTTQAAGSANAVYLKAGGALTNGTDTDLGALIQGNAGVELRGAGTVINFGSIVATAGGSSTAIYLGDGGSLTNGDRDDSSAVVTGAFAIRAFGAAVTVSNFGQITGEAAGIAAYKGGTITNGTAVDIAALVRGGSGINVEGAVGTVTNFGTVLGLASGGVNLSNGGSVINGAPADRDALIEGYLGVFIGNAPGAVTNDGTILARGGAGDFGVEITTGGTLINGAVNNSAALIEGYGGVELNDNGSIANFGTIAALGGPGAGTGVSLLNGASLTNGASNDTAALISGYAGAVINGAATLTNFGTIIGAGGTGVQLQSSKATLAVEAGSLIEGNVFGGGGTLDLASGTGTLSAFGADVTVAGPFPATTFNQFFTLEIGAAARFTLSGNALGDSNQALVLDGVLDAAGTISVAGALTTAGTLAGAGTLVLDDAAATFGAGTSLTLAHVVLEGAKTKVTVATSLTYAGSWKQVAGTVSVSSGKTLTFSGAADDFTGTLTGAGSVAFEAGADTLNGVTLSADGEAITGAAITLEGATSLTRTLSLTGKLTIGAAGASLNGGGEVMLGDLATNAVVGASSAATLTNVQDRILGAGQLGSGKMTLINDAGGVIDGQDAVALVIDTGVATIVNAGVIESTGTGGVVISSAVSNTGTLTVTKGSLTVDGAVSGTGAARISAGVAIFASTFAQNVTFGTTGELELAKSQTYTGAITGFSKTGGTSLVLDDITFGKSTKASYSGTSTSGILTITDGTHTARIKLVGDYTTSKFELSSDGRGGTTVVDPSAAQVSHRTGPTPPHGFIDAMARLGAGSGGPIDTSRDLAQTTLSMMAAPGAQLT